MTKEMERNGLMGERLLKLRNQSSLTQEELAERLDVSRQSISKWELNKTLPDVDKLIQLSEMYQVSIDYLIKGEEALAEEKEKREPEKEAAAVADDMDKTAKEEKKGGGNSISAAEFTVKRIILCICIFLSGSLCLLAVVFTGRLLKNNAFDREGGTQEVVHVKKIYEQYTKAEIAGADFDKEVVWLDVPGVREGDYVFCYPDGERTSFDYYAKTLILPMILGIVFLIFLIVFIMEWRLTAR
ncbi:MAG: helix-turn-helix domain-containing protein [Clostridium sp.]|nr:helix-turn-helix domain-containing protein [Clostridium sp.]